MDRSPALSPFLLSFCIPTYNRAATVHALVKRILSCPADDIEVVVLDNGSTDTTLATLATIEDPRLKVFSNGNNRGVLFNVVNVLLQGRGDYCVLLLDKDSVDPDRIVAFRDFLQSNGVSCGFSEYTSAEGRAPEILAAGVPGLRRIGYSCHHPTGYFFDAHRLRALRINERFIDYEWVGHFPFEFMQAELALQGPVAIYHPRAFATENLQQGGAKKSVGTNASREDAFFSPKGRLKMAVNFSRHIRTLPIPPADQRQLVLDRFFQGLVAATWGYRNMLRDAAVCEHYHIDTRHIGPTELIKLALQFSRGFVQGTRGDGLRDIGVSPIRLLSEVVRRILRGVTRRLTRRFA